MEPAYGGVMKYWSVGVSDVSVSRFCAAVVANLSHSTFSWIGRFDLGLSVFVAATGVGVSSSSISLVETVDES